MEVAALCLLGLLVEVFNVVVAQALGDPTALALERPTLLPVGVLDLVTCVAAHTRIGRAVARAAVVFVNDVLHAQWAVRSHGLELQMCWGGVGGGMNSHTFLYFLKQLNSVFGFGH